jgi:uncharacterized protein (DUF2235 family)
MAKNIVLCLDGTHNQITGVNTNVWRLYSALVRDETQLTYYDPGVGTLLDSYSLTFIRKMARYALDLATATSLRDKFVSAYGFIANHYEPGDRIYIFGFSRGAYIARAVAGAINMFGLFRPGNDNLIPYLWQTYSNDKLGKNAKGESVMFQTAARFRGKVSRPDVKVHFLGLWDTVSAFGVLTRFRTLPSTRANPSVLTVRQAASIDERRSFFRLNRLEPNVKGQDFRQVWFAGYHSDVGGGIAEPRNGLGLISLKWMFGEAEAHLLEVDPTIRKSLLQVSYARYDAPMHNSMSFLQSLMEFMPARTWNKSKGRYTWHWPNWFRHRHIEEGALIHASVEDRLKDPKTKYEPRNIPETFDIARDVTPTHAVVTPAAAAVAEEQTRTKP